MDIGCNRDESMTSAAEPIDAMPLFAEHSHARAVTSQASSIESNSSSGECNAALCA